MNEGFMLAATGAATICICSRDGGTWSNNVHLIEDSNPFHGSLAPLQWPLSR